MPWLIEVANVRAALRLTAAAFLLANLAACVAPPPPPMVEAPAPVTPDRIVELTVFFDFDSHTIRPEVIRAAGQCCPSVE